MQTIWMLMAKYEGMPSIPLDTVRKDFFEGMSQQLFINKIKSGEIPLPVQRLGEGQKATKRVPLTDLAAYLDHEANRARAQLVNTASHAPRKA